MKNRNFFFNFFPIFNEHQFNFYDAILICDAIYIYLMSRAANGPNRGTYTERQITELILGNFQAEGSRGYEFLVNFFGRRNQVTVNRLRSLSMVLSRVINIPISRNEKRDRRLLIRWFDIHLDQIEEVIDHVQMIKES